MYNLQVYHQFQHLKPAEINVIPLVQRWRTINFLLQHVNFFCYFFNELSREKKFICWIWPQDTFENIINLHFTDINRFPSKNFIPSNMESSSFVGLDRWHYNPIFLPSNFFTTEKEKRINPPCFALHHHQTSIKKYFIQHISLFLIASWILWLDSINGT